MATNPTLPSDPHAMPMDQLKQAAGLDQPVAQPQPATPPPAPVVPEAFSVKQDDSGVTIQMAPEFGGEVFKGKDWAEVGPKIAKAKADANAYIKQLKSQPTVEPEPTVTPPTEVPEDPQVLAVRNWLMEETAKALGLSKDEYLARVGMVFDTSEKMAVNIALADFHQACPDYLDTPENSAALASYFPDDYQGFPSAQELKQAYALAVYEGKIQRGTPTVAPSGMPPPMPGSTVSQLDGDQSAWSMPLDRLKTAAGLK